MNNLGDKPQHTDIPDNIGNTHLNNRERVFNSFVDGIIDSTFIAPLHTETKVRNCFP